MMLRKTRQIKRRIRTALRTSRAATQTVTNRKQLSKMIGCLIDQKSRKVMLKVLMLLM